MDKISWSRDEVVDLFNKWLDCSSTKNERFKSFLKRIMDEWLDENLR